MPRKDLTPRPDGRYVCKYKGKFFYGRTSDEAKQARKEYIRQEASGQLLRHELTVKDYAMKWLPLYKRGVSEKTYNDYAKQLEALFPVIGNKHLSQVTVDDAAAVWSHYAGYSASTIKRARMLYIIIFEESGTLSGISGVSLEGSGLTANGSSIGTWSKDGDKYIVNMVGVGSNSAMFFGQNLLVQMLPTVWYSMQRMNLGSWYTDIIVRPSANE